MIKVETCTIFLFCLSICILGTKARNHFETKHNENEEHDFKFSLCNIKKSFAPNLIPYPDYGERLNIETYKCGENPEAFINIAKIKSENGLIFKFTCINNHINNNGPMMFICNSIEDCELYKKCFTKSMSDHRKCFLKSRTTFEIFNPSNEDRQGIFFCPISTNEALYFYIFRNSHQQTNFDINEMQLYSDIKLNNSEPALYFKESPNFTDIKLTLSCSGLSFFYSSGFELIFKPKNETSSFSIDKSLFSIDNSTDRVTEIYNFNLKTDDSFEAFCVPKGNEFLHYNFNVSTEVHKSTKPKIIQFSPSGNLTIDNSKELKLICKAKGFPFPKVEIKFLLKGSNRTSEFMQLIQDQHVSKTFDPNDPEISIITYTLAPHSVREGNYFCSANNAYGNSDDVLKTITFQEPVVKWLWISLIGLITAVLILIIIPILFMKHTRHRSLGLKKVLKKIPKSKLISNKDLEYEEDIGGGHFGTVFKAKMISTGNFVAVKRPKNILNNDHIESLFDEIGIHLSIGEHENIVKFIGCVTKNFLKCREIYLVTEYCSSKDLSSYIKENSDTYIDDFDKTSYGRQKNPTYVGNIFGTVELLNFAIQIVEAMKYLSEKKIVHRDLAARNVLLTNDKIIKLTDFGLSRNLYDKEYYTQISYQPTPYKWHAIETLTTKTFTTKSDVWSFGMTLWEMFNLVIKVPYGEKSRDQLKEFLLAGKREESADKANKVINDMIRQCWESEPDKRPTFEDLGLILTNQKHLLLKFIKICK